MRTAHGNKYYFLFFQRSRSRRAYLPERYHHCHCRLVARPLGAFLVGGVGAFLGDFFFYPLPMFVSLGTHGIRSVVMSLIVGRYGRDNFPVVLGATILGALIAIAGYTLGKAYVYSTWEYAMLKLPFEILQAFIGSAIGLFLWKNRKWGKTIRRFLGY